MMQCTANLLFPYLRNHGLLVIKAISSQHQISIACFPACEKKWATLPLLRSLVRSSHIHSKTACRGFKSFCPCHKPGGNTVFLPGFFLHVVHGNGVRFGSNSGFSHPVLPVLNRFHPLQHPKRTRFRPFRTISGAFFSFSLFFGRKIFGSVFVHPAA